jgi:BMFP domain-containing protein YqiC
MTQSSNKLLDDFARLVTDAAGAAQGIAREAQTAMRAQGERILSDMDVVRREEFEAVKAMAVKARDENERLTRQVEALETAMAEMQTRHGAMT